jgi:hypothetical protein
LEEVTIKIFFQPAMRTRARRKEIIMTKPIAARFLKSFVVATWRNVGSLLTPSKSNNAQRLRQRGETVESLVIREATVEDIPALAQLHVTTPPMRPC